MQTETKDNVQRIDVPPLPPPAHFDALDIAEAKPVQPIPSAWRRTTDTLQRIFCRRILVIAVITEVVAIFAVVATASVDWHSNVQPSSGEMVNSINQSADEPATPPTTSIEKVNSVRMVRRAHHSSRRIRRPLFTLFDDELPAFQTLRPRLVTVVH
ncbi:MAG TPA: hypothetical protein VFU37_17425 [Pyrinomonadaceae bacterium]|nr:hypothetical protein [Pyrinomonadaceae bacterium]